MANYNLTNQEISSSFQQLMQYDRDTGSLYDGTGSLIENIQVTASYADASDWSGINNKPSGIISGSTQLPSGLVSGSTQIVTEDTQGTFSGFRINGAVALATSASHAEFADQATQAEDLFITVKNTSGGIINKGLAVHATGVTGENVNVILADSSVPANMPAIGLLEETLGINATGRAVIGGRIKNIDTSGLVAGQSVYVNGAGLLTTNKPTGSDLIQAIGVAGKINASDGEIVVQGAGRTNDLPNIQSGYAWVGNVDHVPTAVSTASWDAQADLTELNAFTASYYIDSASFDTRIDDIVASGSGADWNVNLTNIPAGLVSGSSQLTSSYDTRYALSGSEAGLPSGVVSGSSQISYPDISNIPGGIVSGSDQLTGSLDSRYVNETDFTNFSQSIDERIDSASFDTSSFAKTDQPNTFIDAQTIESTLIVSQSAGITGSIMHFPLTGGGGLQGIASNRFFNVGPNLFEQSYQGIDKYILQTVGTGEMEISAATSMVLNPATSGNGNLVSTKIMTQQDSALSTTGQKDSITIGAYTGSNGVIYTSNVWGIQNYPGIGYHNAFVAGKYNSGFTKVSEMRVDEGVVQMTIGDGDANYNFIQIADNNAGQSQITLNSDFIVGTGNTNINNVNIGVNNPTSQSLFVADGASPRIQVYSQTDAASNGTNVEFTGNVTSQNLSVTPNSPASQSLHVDNGAQSVLVVHSQNEQSANGIHATINGNVQIGAELKLGGNLDMGAAAGGGVINIPNGQTFTNTLHVNNVQVLTGGGQINFPSHTHFGDRITSDVDNITITSNTASIDLNGPTMGELTLPASGDTRIEFSNATDGQIYNLLVKQSGAGTVSLPASILQPSGSGFAPTSTAGGRDILTLATYDYSTTSEIYLINVVNLV